MCARSTVSSNGTEARPVSDPDVRLSEQFLGQVTSGVQNLQPHHLPVDPVTQHHRVHSRGRCEWHAQPFGGKIYVLEHDVGDI